MKCSSVGAALLVALSISAQQPAGSPPAAASPAVNAPAGNSSADAKLALEESRDLGEPVYNVGGSVQPPIVVHQQDPKFTLEARRAKFSGNVVIGMVVDSQGKPRDVHIVRALDMFGLDENALKAVRRYRFRPALKDGKPVAVRLNVMVNFVYINNQ